MSILSIAVPVAGVARPLISLGVVVALLLVFKPLLVGLLRAALLTIKPRKSLEEREARRLFKSRQLLSRLAKDFEHSHPSQAAELRWFASRN